MSEKRNDLPQREEDAVCIIAGNGEISIFGHTDGTFSIWIKHDREYAEPDEDEVVLEFIESVTRAQIWEIGRAFLQIAGNVP